MYNNVAPLVNANLTGTRRGPNDDIEASRIGDEIIPIGVRITFTWRCFGEYPDQYFRWWICRGSAGHLPTLLPFRTIAGTSLNVMIDTVDTEKIKIVKSGTFRSHGANETHTLSANDKTTYRKIWYKFPKMKIKYPGDEVVPYPFEYGLYCATFFGTNLGTGETPVCALVNQSAFYFKDP